MPWIEGVWVCDGRERLVMRVADRLHDQIQCLGIVASLQLADDVIEMVECDMRESDDLHGCTSWRGSKP